MDCELRIYFGFNENKEKLNIIFVKTVVQLNQWSVVVFINIFYGHTINAFVICIIYK